MQENDFSPTKSSGGLSLWLWIVCGMIVAMVAVGGITRLTESGLSIVNWAPILGVFPPADEAEWNATFELYKATPQFAKFNEQSPMSLHDFKGIYFWEYVHRLLGRMVGVVYAIPLFFFLATRRLRGKMAAKLLFALVLGGGQGFLGWYMVQSGLVDKPYVSHFRLAAHLSLALFLFAYLLWQLFDLNPYWTHRKTNYDSVKGLRRAAWVFLALLILQIVYGAFVAGLDAGFMHNTYPLMGRRFFPADGWHERFEPLWTNVLSNPATVQFIHRHLGLLLVAYLFVLWWKAVRMHLMVRQKLAFNLLLTGGVLQFILGLMTLVMGVPIVIAVLHQVMACFLLGATVMVLYELAEPKTVISLRS
jgi:cytochrome c oxidase assembly protein subunit 15